MMMRVDADGGSIPWDPSDHGTMGAARRKLGFINGHPDYDSLALNTQITPIPHENLLSIIVVISIQIIKILLNYIEHQSQI